MERNTGISEYITVTNMETAMQYILVYKINKYNIY